MRRVGQNRDQSTRSERPTTIDHDLTGIVGPMTRLRVAQSRNSGIHHSQHRVSFVKKATIPGPQGVHKRAGTLLYQINQSPNGVLFGDSLASEQTDASIALSGDNPSSFVQPHNENHTPHGLQRPTLRLFLPGSPILLNSNADSNGMAEGNLLDTAQSPREETPSPISRAQPAKAAFAAFDPALTEELYFKLEQEASKRPSFEYMETLQAGAIPVDKRITARHRRLCVSWMIEVCDSEEVPVDYETMFMAVQLLDRLLSVVEVPHTSLQLMACACILLAAKFYSENFPTAHLLSTLSDFVFDRRDLIKAESVVLKALDYKLAAPTAFDFLCRLQALFKLTPSVHFLATYILELSLIDYGSLQLPPSALAAAAVIWATEFHESNSSIFEPMCALLPSVVPYLERADYFIFDLIKKASFGNERDPDFDYVLEKYNTRQYSCLAQQVVNKLCQFQPASSAALF